jgi:hypothetical protein
MKKHPQHPQSNFSVAKPAASNLKSCDESEEQGRQTFKERLARELRGCSVGLAIAAYFLTLQFLGVKIDIDAIFREAEHLLTSGCDIFWEMTRGL